MLKIFFFRERNLSLFISAIIMGFIPSAFSYAANLSIEQVSIAKSIYSPGEELFLKVVWDGGLKVPSTTNINLSSTNGGEFSSASLTSGECGEFSSGPANTVIASGTSQKAFCYRNHNPGLDNITAFFLQGTTSGQTTFDVMIGCPVSLTESATLMSTEGCEDDSPSMGTLIIRKVVVGEEGADYTQFSYTIDGLSTSSFPAGGEVTLEREAGSYVITEGPTSGYEVTYDNCSPINVNTEGTSTCTITNTKIEEAPLPRLYDISGQVFDDDNEDGYRDEGELALSGWTINITDGSTTLAITSDESGRYLFNVPAGTWVITENLPENWKRTTAESYTVVIAEEEEEEIFVWRTVWNYLFPVAYAAMTDNRACLDNNCYDFGNNQIPPPVISTTDTSSSHSSGGRVGRPKKDNSSTITIKPPTPAPQVLGEQISIVPVGAPKTGAGGTSPLIPTLTIGHLLYVRRVISVKFKTSSK